MNAARGNASCGVVVVYLDGIETKAGFTITVKDIEPDLIASWTQVVPPHPGMDTDATRRAMLAEKIHAVNKWS